MFHVFELEITKVGKGIGGGRQFNSTAMTLATGGLSEDRFKPASITNARI